MEQLAVLSDLHANLNALRAVITDLDQRRIQRVVVLGDVVGYLARPNRVAALVRQKGWPIIRGNYDQAVLEGPETGPDRFLKKGMGPEPRRIYEWTHRRVAPETLDFLSRLPLEYRFRFQGADCLAVHGSPENIRQYVKPDHDPAELAAWLVKEKADLLLMGHTHLPMVIRLKNGLVLNPGSVGKSKDGDPRASYAILTRGRTGLHAQIVKVEYDIQEEADLIEKQEFPASQIQRLLSGR